MSNCRLFSLEEWFEVQHNVKMAGWAAEQSFWCFYCPVIKWDCQVLHLQLPHDLLRVRNMWAAHFLIALPVLSVPIFRSDVSLLSVYSADIQYDRCPVFAWANIFFFYRQNRGKNTPTPIISCRRRHSIMLRWDLLFTLRSWFREMWII